MAYLLGKIIQCLGNIRCSPVIVIGLYLYRYVIKMQGNTRGEVPNGIAHLLTLIVLVTAIDVLQHFETG